MKNIPFARSFTADEMGNIYKPNGKPAALTPHSDGYLRVRMNKKQYYVHRVILETFKGKCPKGMQTRHLNGNPKDNRIENLAWGTKLENEADKMRHGTHQAFLKSARKLTDEQVDYILATTDKTQQQLANELGVSQSTISFVVNGRTFPEKNAQRKFPLKHERQWKAGADNYRAKLTEDQAREIKGSTERNVDLAKKYNVSQKTISAIKLGHRWKHL